MIQEGDTCMRYPDKFLWLANSDENGTQIRHYTSTGPTSVFFTVYRFLLNLILPSKHQEYCQVLQGIPHQDIHKVPNPNDPLIFPMEKNEIQCVNRF